MSSSVDGKLQMVGDLARHGYGIEGMLLGAQRPALPEAKGRRSGSRSCWRPRRRYRSDCCRVRPRVRRRKRVGRREPQRIAHLLPQVSDATSCPAAAAKQRCAETDVRSSPAAVPRCCRQLEHSSDPEARSASLAISASHHCVNWFGSPSKNISIEISTSWQTPLVSVLIPAPTALRSPEGSRRPVTRDRVYRSTP